MTPCRVCKILKEECVLCKTNRIFNSQVKNCSFCPDKVPCPNCKLQVGICDKCLDVRMTECQICQKILCPDHIKDISYFTKSYQLVYRSLILCPDCFHKGKYLEYSI